MRHTPSLWLSLSALTVAFHAAAAPVGLQSLKAGDSAAWKSGVANGHCLINRTDRDVKFIEVGSRAVVERAHYSDIDMMVVRDDKGFRYSKKNGDPFSP